MSSINFKNKSDIVVLIVDDVSIMRKMLKQILNEHCNITSNNILEANDGANAVLLYKKCKPDIVFLDIAMPDKDGKTVIEELKSIDSEVIIIMCTGSGNKHNVIDCIRAGAKDYVRKPINPERVKEALDKVMGDILLKGLYV